MATKKATTEKKTDTKTTTKKIESTKAKAVKVEEAAVEATTSKESELEALVKEQAAIIEQLKAQLTSGRPASADSGEKVAFLWQAPVADENVVEFGERGRFGRIVGKIGTIIIPKNELSQIMDTPIRYYMDKRWLVVLSGMDEQEREMYGVNYKPGEYLSKEAFLNVVGLGKDVLNVYPGLCESHKEIVAKLFWEAWQAGQDIERDIVVALNKISKREAFKAIIDEMNQRDASED